MEEALGRPAQPVMTQRGRVVAVFHLDLPKVTRPRFNELPLRTGGGVGVGGPSRFNLWASSEDAK